MTALRAEGCGIARRAISMKSALRIYLSVSYSKISITVISHLRWLSPFGALRHHLPPAEWWDNKEPQSNSFISSSQHNGALLSPVEVLHRTFKWGEVRRLACPLRRFPFVARPIPRWQGNTIRKGAKRPENRVTRFPAGREGGAIRHQRGKATGGG